MKKLLLLLLSLTLCLTAVFAIGCNSDSNKVTLTYYDAAPTLVGDLSDGTISVGLLPEPACTGLTKTATNYTWTRLDLQEGYDATSKTYPQAVLMVKESVLNTYPNLVTYLTTTFDVNMAWVKANTATAVNAVNAKVVSGVTPSLKAPAITSQVVDNCKIYWESAISSKTAVGNYLADIKAINDVSANIVTDDYYYAGSSAGVNTSETLKFVAPDGAPALAIAKYINDNDDLGTAKAIDYSVVAAGGIGNYMLDGVADIMIMPVNQASKLYKANTADPYKMVSVVTHGNLYIMSSEDITLDGLKGKTIGVIGRGAVPDLTLQAVLKKNGIEFKIA